MKRLLAAVAILVPDYDTAIDYYRSVLGFHLVEDTHLGDEKRWVLVAPDPASPPCLLLAKAATDAQRAAVGNQAGGRVFLFLETDDFDRDHARFAARGVRFLNAPRQEAYGKVAVFVDAFGNKWDLIEPSHRA